MRRVAMVVAMAAVGVAGTAGTASAATNVLYLSQGSSTHTCNVIGDDGYYQGVVCVDLRTYSGYTNDSGAQIPPGIGLVAELICQVGPGQPNYGQEVQCAHAAVSGALANAERGTYWDGEFSYPAYSNNHSPVSCGHQFGPCSSSRNIFLIAKVADTGGVNDNCASTSSTWDNYWGVLYGDPSVYGAGPTGIELPGSGKWVYLNELHSNGVGGNESTGHYQVCA